MGKIFKHSWHEAAGVAAGFVVAGLAIGLLETFVIMPLLGRPAMHPGRKVLRRAGFGLY